MGPPLKQYPIRSNPIQVVRLQHKQPGIALGLPVPFGQQVGRFRVGRPFFPRDSPPAGVGVIHPARDQAGGYFQYEFGALFGHSGSFERVIRRSPLRLDGVTPEPTYLACTKAPPGDVPKSLGLGSCVAPRNHKGDCQYAFAGGVATVGRGPSPMDRAEHIERLYRSTRRAYVVSLAATSLSVFSAVFLVLKALGQTWP
jgi:hypothetical protein